MHLIFGGAYQGKLEYAKTKFDIKDSEIYECAGIDACETPEECLDLLNLARSVRRAETKSNSVQQSKSEIKVINGIERFAFACAVHGIEAAEHFRKNPEFWQDKILIVTDVSQGIVPMDKDQRAWREMNGRMMAYLASEAETVTRIFCGLPQLLKP